MGTKFAYEADLTQDSLAELLIKLYRHRVPGVVEARRDEVTKKIWIKDGNVIYASSSDRADSLGDYLVRQELITEKQLQMVGELHAVNKKRIGMLLMEQEFLSPKELNEAIRAQIERIAWSLFSWTSGRAVVDLHELNDHNILRIQLPLRQMVFKGIVEAANERSLVDRLGGKNAQLEPNWQGETLIDCALDREQFQFLLKVDGRKTLRELAHLGPYSVARNVRLLYALQVLHLIRGKASANGAIRLRLAAR